MPIIRNLCCSLLLSAAWFLSGTVSAAPVIPDAGWYGFCFSTPGAPVYDGCQNQGVGTTGSPFSVNLLAPGWLKVTDAFDVGDQFDVYVDSLLAFSTSVPGTGSWTDDPDVAFSSGHYSAGSKLLAAGSYSIDIQVTNSPLNGGGAYVSIATQQATVPAPATLLLLVVGLLGVIGMRRQQE